MPVLQSSYTRPPFYLFSGKLETVYPSIFRKVKNVTYTRERLELPDGDFVDLDWLKSDSPTLVVITHGLESSTNRAYMQGMAKYFHDRNWEVLTWNCRSCSGEMNRKLRLYSHGEIDDIHRVIQHANQLKDYKNIALIGFSMGGNITIKYVSVHAHDLSSNIKAAVAFSTPTDLGATADALDQPERAFFKKYFHTKLSEKIKRKAADFPDEIDLTHIDDIASWRMFDERYSAKINGFKSAQDFYDQASANNFLPNISLPTLLVNAQNDPVLTPECFPFEIAKKNPQIYFEAPKRGGHVGFLLSFKSYAWSEKRAFDFVEEQIKNN